MKGVLVLLFALVSTVNAQGQTTRSLYYNEAWNLTKKDAAIYFRVCGFDTIRREFAGEFKDFTSDGKVIMTGSYSGGKKNGRFVSFFDNGVKASEGAYEENIRNGSWTYYHHNGSLKYEVEFLSGRPGIRSVRDSTGRTLAENGTGTWFEVYDESPGTRISVKGKLKDYEYDGTWTQALPDGTVFTSSRFSNGKFLDGRIEADCQSFSLLKPLIVVLPEDFKHLRTESFTHEPDVSNSDYPFILRKRLTSQQPAPVPDADIVFVITEISASPAGGMAAFYYEIRDLIKYPKEARRKKVEGNVYVEFVVNVDGSLSDIKTVKGIGAGCDEAAVFAVQESQKIIRWIPGIQRRKCVRQRFTLPIHFGIPD